MQPRRLSRGLGLAAVLVALLAFAPFTGARLTRAANNNDNDNDWVRIDWPTDGIEVGGVVEIRGRAATTDPAAFDYYRLYAGLGKAARQLRPITPPITSPATGGVIASIDTAALAPGDVTLVVRVYGKDGDVDEATVAVVIAGRSPPTGQVAVPPVIAPPLVVPPDSLADPASLPEQAPVNLEQSPSLPPVQLDPVGPGGPVSPIQQLNPQPNPIFIEPNDPVQLDPRTDHIDLQPALSEPITITNDPIPVSGGGSGSGSGSGD